MQGRNIKWTEKGQKFAQNRKTTLMLSMLAIYWPGVSVRLIIYAFVPSL